MLLLVAVSVVGAVVSAMCVAVLEPWDVGMYMLTVIHHNADIDMSGVGELFLHCRWLCYCRWLCLWQG